MKIDCVPREQHQAMTPSVEDSLTVQDFPGAAPRRPRVLLAAYACSPEYGSEPGVGWYRALTIARFCDTWVLCEEHEYGPALLRYLDAHGPIPGLEFVFVPKVAWLNWRGWVPGLKYVGYNHWQRRAYQVAVRLHAKVRFDLVHQLTLCGFREPGYLWRMGVPFVWGPVGGTQNYPWRFLGQAGPLGALREVARNVVNRLQLYFSPRVHRAARTAAALLAANSTIQEDLARACGVTPQVQHDTATPEVLPTPRPSRGAVDRVRLLWSGDLRCWKALPLLIQALARVPRDIDCVATVLGRGLAGRALAEAG